jgi:hypothetical protein
MAARARRRRVLGCVALVVSPTVLLAAPARAAAAPRCTQLVLTPDFATSRTAYCAAFVRDGSTASITLARSTDAGRSWQRATGTGLTAQADDHEARLLVSTEYGSDHALYVTLDTSGTFRSVDRGESFVLADPNGSGVVAATRTVGTGPLPPVAHGVLLVAKYGVAEGANNSFAVDPPLPRAPVSGTPGLDLAFAAAPDRPSTVLAFGASGAGASYRVTAYGCSATFSCTTTLGSLPAGQSLDRVWLSPRFGADGVVLVRTVDRRFRTVFLRSVDGGRTFRALTSAQRLADAVYAAGGTPQSDVAGTVVHGRARLYLRLADPSVRKTGPPAEQILVSDDLGASWRLVAYGRQPSQPGPRGAVPPSALPGVTSEAPGFVTVATDRLFLAGFRGVLCSTDGGAHWAAACAR